MPTRVAVIGTGAFGRNHLRVYRELEAADPSAVTLAALVDPDPSRREAAAPIPAFASIADLLASGPPIDAASICVPTVHHAEVAIQLLEAGIDVLIEKPIAASREQADAIHDLAHRLGRIVAVGHLERFNPAVTALIPRLTRPMFFEAHRLSIFTRRSLDVDVVLDLMIHDLDIVLALAASEVRDLRAVGIPILSRKADIANVRLEFASGCVANFTASRVSTEQVRKLRLFQPHQYLSLDFARQELLSIDVDPTALDPTRRHPERSEGPPHFSDTASTFTMPQLAHPERSTQCVVEGPATPSAPPTPPEAFQPPTHPSAGLNLQKLDLPHAEPLRLELENFLASVRTRTRPRVNAAAGRAALTLALEINREIAAHAARANLT